MVFFHQPESVTVSAQSTQYFHAQPSERCTLGRLSLRLASPFRHHTVEVPMGKLSLFLGGFLLITLLVGLLGTIPPG